MSCTDQYPQMIYWWILDELLDEKYLCVSRIVCHPLLGGSLSWISLSFKFHCRYIFWELGRPLQWQLIPHSIYFRNFIQWLLYLCTNHCCIAGIPISLPSIRTLLFVRNSRRFPAYWESRESLVACTLRLNKARGSNRNCAIYSAELSELHQLPTKSVSSHLVSGGELRLAENVRNDITAWTVWRGKLKNIITKGVMSGSTITVYEAHERTLYQFPLLCPVWMLYKHGILVLNLWRNRSGCVTLVLA